MKKHIQNDDVIRNQKEERTVATDQKNDGEMWKEKYLRALADYQNLEKRTEKEHHQARTFAGVMIIEKLLPVVDLLEKAVQHLKDQGLDLALKELYAFFHSVGVAKIDVMGKAFDPYTMDCVETKAGGVENKVISVVSDGYLMHNKLIRPAKVIVGKRLEEKDINSINKD